ncbi:NAD(P)-dependent oxidoreductase [Telmatospirillum siberiense]|uniref:NAD(P)-dependent oxidoreductase n=1 Tax=Telmatospirillum siberiense TaxID=382514 RepID=A0A2N3PTA1_9PROT|nr:NAD(P)-dependent oxidoreductase [Telmatospirillum siberiense]
MSSTRLLVTGAGGQLGHLVVSRLLELVPPSQIVATVRNVEAGRSLAARGVEIRIADYTRSETLDAAFAGIGRLLLISSNALGQRVAQHKNVIEAAKRAGVGLLAYTSLLRADGSPLGLAGEHRETEALLRNSGLPFVLLRNGWYTENYTAAVPTALAHGVLIGGAGAGRIASAARADYAAAAAAVLTATENLGGRTFELAGDQSYTLTELAAEITRQSGRQVVYKNLSRADHKAALLGAGLPEPVADLLSDSDAGAAKGALFDDGRQLSTLIGRPTTPLAASITAALKQ